tara:strand:- start:3404 stop:4108 length:705 start_codon:yes stop_codon:yes gene_type:complete
MKFYKSKKLLNIDNNAKTVKGQKYKYLTGILYLAPARTSGFNVCPMASAGCKASCLFTAGRGRFNNVMQGRINKTRWFFLERNTFLKQLKNEIKKLIIKAKKIGLKPAVRLNGTSDIDWNNHGLYNEFKQVKFYDYTKIYKRALKYVNGAYPKNYHLTYSLNEDNKQKASYILKRGGNISAVFRSKKLPKRFLNYKVFNGDKSDLRFNDPKNVIIGLYAKGRALKDQTGFVQDV